MAEPEMSQWGERLRERTQPLQPDDEQYGWAHAILCETLAQPFLQLAELVDPPDPLAPWAPLFDVNLCPDWALPWLAQLVGARLPTGIDEEEARTYILDVAGHRLGTSASMTAAVRSTLVPAHPPTPATVWFRERDGSPYRLEVVTLEGETPDPENSLRVLLGFKPGGLVLSFRQVEGWDYQQQTVIGGTYAEQSAQFATYRQMREYT
jgi:hypothetical protein